MEKALSEFIEILKCNIGALSLDNFVSLGLMDILNTEGSLTVFQSLVEATTLKEEIKKPKVKKSKQPVEVVEEEPPENPSVVNIRALALKCWYYLWLPLSRNDRNECNQLRVAMASISSVTNSLCESISMNSNHIAVSDSEQPSEKVLHSTQNMFYATKVLVHTLRYQRENVRSFLQHKVAGEFAILARNKEISLNVHQVLHILSCDKESIQFVASVDHINLLFQLAEESVAKLKEIVIAPVEAAPVKGKEVKKDDKNKKGAPAPVVEKPVNPFEKLDLVTVETKRNFICFLSLFTGIVSEIAQNCHEYFTEEFVGRYLAIYHDIALNETVWECLRAPLEAPFDEPINNFLERISLTTGQLCEISEEHRIKVCESNGILLLLSMLLASSKAIAVDDVDREVKQEKLKQLRRLIEKSLLAAASSKMQEEAVSESVNRWHYSKSLTINKVIFHSFGGDMLAKTVEAISSEDLDVSFRAVKFLATIVCAITEADRQELISEFQIDKLSCGKLSHFVSVVASKLYEKEQQLIVHELDATLDEVLYLALATIEVFLPLSSDHIKSFSDKNRLETLCKLVDGLGITSANLVPENSEWTTTIHDPRHYGWNLSLKDSFNNEAHQLRPLIIDILRLIVESGEKYRNYEQPIPYPPCTPIPVSTSVCDDACFTTVKLFSDICLKVLLSSAKMVVVDDVVQVQLNREANLSVLVRNSALRFLSEVAKTGALGLTGMMETIASKGFSQEYNESSMNILFQSLADVTSGQDLTDFSWKRPQFFSDFNLSAECNPYSTSVVIENRSIWPLVLLSAALFGVLFDPDSHLDSLSLVLDVVKQCSATKHFDENSTPVLCDLFSAIFLAGGGGMSMVSVLGRFANLSDDAKSLYFPLLQFLFSRGSSREKFWKEWAESHKEEVQLDPKTGKPIVKKDDKDKKGKDTKKPDPKAAVNVIPPVFVEVVYNVESTAEFPDPNKGPTVALWKSILDLQFDCQHTWLDQATILIGSVVSGLSWLGEILITQEHIEIDTQDLAGRSAIMYALLLNDSNALRFLLAHGANLNLVDSKGFPTIHYALSTLDEDDIQRKLPGHAATKQLEGLEILGHSLFLENILGGRVDLNVSDEAGYSALLFSLGMGRLVVDVGGYSFRIRNEAYHKLDYPRENILKTVEMLLASGADVNYCSKKGLTSLHVACCRGDTSLVKLILDNGINPNGLDNRGCHSLHYLFASCPEESKALFDLLIRKCNFRPAEKLLFSDYRTGRSNSIKEETELINHLDEALQLCFQPLVLNKYRLQYGELFSLPATDYNVTPLMMLFAGPQILQDDIEIFEMLHIDDNKESRIDLALHVIAFAEKQQSLTELMSTTASSNITLLHCFSLLLRGTLPKIFLTEREKRAKRVRKFESKETQLTEYIFENHKTLFIDDLHSTWIVKDLGIDSPWTPFHAAIINGNIDLINLLISHYPTLWTTWMPIHIMCATKVELTDPSIATTIVKLCTDHELHKMMLNDGNDYYGQIPPLHLAIQNKQYLVIDHLAQCTKVDLNQRHPHSGIPPIYAACATNDLELVRAFTCGRDRVDLTLKDAVNGLSCVEFVVNDRNVDMLMELLKLRKNDVIEQLISEDASGYSLLKQMEQNHFAQLEQEGRAPSAGPSNIIAMETEEAAISFEVPTQVNVEIEDDNGEVKITSVTEENQDENAGIDNKIMAVKEASSSELCSYTEFLKILEDLVNSTGIIESHHHFHAIYADESYLSLVYDA